MKDHKLPLIIKHGKTLLEDNLLVKHYAGSLAYGTNLPSSDVDIRGLFCADPVNIRTPFYTVKEVEVTEEEDTKYYELTHFLKLVLDCNPNVIETLWVEEGDILETSPAYQMLREHRHSLLSSKIAFTTSGYAISQLSRIKGHNKWINNPQLEEPPRQIDFIKLVQNFSTDKMFSIKLEDFRDNYRLIPYGGDIFGLITKERYQTYSDDYSLNTTYDGESEVNVVPLCIVKFLKSEYKLAMERWEQYWSWKRNRNQVRSELEEKYGFDCKHAMHLVRLLRMGVEALRDEEIVVKRPDAEELLSIRNGAWTYEEILEYAGEMDNKIKELYKKTKLRKKPDIKFAASLLMDLQDMVWNKS